MGVIVWPRVAERTRSRTAMLRAMNTLRAAVAMLLVAGCLSPVDESLSTPNDAGTGGSTIHSLVTTELKSDASWRVSGLPPVAGWNSAPTFDQSAWTAAVMQIPQGASSNNASIWNGVTPGSGSQQLFIRKTFTVTGEVLSAKFTVACNDDMDVWINGTNVVSESDGVTSYRDELDVGDLLIPGENLIAANCRDVVGPEHSFHSWLIFKTWK